MKVYGLLGEKLRHSFSPKIHAVYGDYYYVLFETEPNRISEFFKAKLFDGLNVTVPYKQTVIPFCQGLSPIAKRLGAVNTIIKKNGGLFGDNTDYIGFLYLLKKSKIDIKGKKVIILGSGASSRTVRAVCEDLNVGNITVISRTGENNYENLNKHYDAQIIINTTPVGMYPKNINSPIKLADFISPEAVIDLIYNPLKTILLMEAEELGIPFVNGLPMLAAQAKTSSEMFTGVLLEDTLIEKATKSVKNKMQNIVLIGMPGCGKTSVGRALAKKVGKKFLDTDEAIYYETKRTPADIIRQDGEEFFRKIESVVAARAGRSTCHVVATGGGMVLNEQNMLSFSQNAVIIHLERSIDKLITEDRPLSENSLDDLFKVRQPLYEKYADYTVDSNESVENTTNKIIELIKSISG